MFPRALPRIIARGFLCVFIVMWIYKGDLRMQNTHTRTHAPLENTTRERGQTVKQHQFQTSSSERSRSQFTNATFSGKQGLKRKERLVVQPQKVKIELLF